MKNLIELLAFAVARPTAAEYLDTGLVTRLPSVVLAVSLTIVAALAWTAGFILDIAAKPQRASGR